MKKIICPACFGYCVQQVSGRRYDCSSCGNVFSLAGGRAAKEKEAIKRFNGLTSDLHLAGRIAWPVRLAAIRAVVLATEAVSMPDRREVGAWLRGEVAKPDNYEAL